MVVLIGHRNICHYSAFCNFKIVLQITDKAVSAKRGFANVIPLGKPTLWPAYYSDDLSLNPKVCMSKKTKSSRDRLIKGNVLY